MKTVKFIRKPFPVDAVQVTRRNMVEVAAWCQGEIQYTSPKSAPAGDDGRRPYIKVRVLRPMGEKQTQAFEGDWVLYAGTGYKVYRDAAFHGSFERVRVQDVEEVTAEPPYPGTDEEDFPAIVAAQAVARTAAVNPEGVPTPASMPPRRGLPDAPRVVGIETADGVVNYSY